MPEEATRRLLKQFGMAVTDLEDETRGTLARLQALGPPPCDAAISLEIVGQWLKLGHEVTERWLEITRLIVENQTKGQAELLRLIGDALPAGK